MIPKIDCSICCLFNTSRLHSIILILHKTLVRIRVTLIANFSFRCSGSQIEISIMKSVSEDQCECFLIYDHDDLTHLDIEINFLKKIIFQQDLSSKLASKKRLKEILKEIGKEIFHRIRFFDLDAF